MPVEWYNNVNNVPVVIWLIYRARTLIELLELMFDILEDCKLIS